MSAESDCTRFWLPHLPAVSMAERSLLHPAHTPLTPVPASSDEGSNSDAADVPKRRHQHDTAMAAMQSSAVPTSPIAAFAFTPSAVPAHATHTTPPRHKSLVMPQLAVASSHAHSTFVPFFQLPGVRPLLCASLLWIFLSHTPRGLLAAHDPWRHSGPSCLFVGGFVFSIGVAALLALGAIMAYPLLYSAAHMARGAHSVWASLRRAFESFCIGLPCIGAATSVVAMVATLGPRPDCWHDQPLREWAVMDALVVAALCSLTAVYSFLRYPAVSKILLATHSQGSHGGPPASPLLSGRHELKSQRERLHRWLVELAGSLLVARAHLRKYGRVWLCALAVLMIGAETWSQRSYHALMLRSPHFSLVDRPAPCLPDCSDDSMPLERRRQRVCVSGDMQRMPVQECLAQSVAEQLPRNHEVFDACKDPACRTSHGLSIRYFWAQRHERLAGSSGASSSLLRGFASFASHTHRCSLHDQRRQERVAFSSEWVCWDDVKHQWADTWFCDGSNPPYCKTGVWNKHDVWYVTTAPSDHCTNPCEPIQAALARWSAMWIAFLLVSAATWAARWKAGLPLFSAQFSRASGDRPLVARPRAGSSPVSPGLSPPASSAALQIRLLPLFGLSLPALSAEELYVLHDARTQLYRRLANRMLIVRAGVYLQFTLMYGLGVMHRNIEYCARWIGLAALIALQVDVTHWIVWLVDSPCYAFTALLFAHAAIISFASAALLLALLLHLQQPNALANLPS